MPVSFGTFAALAAASALLALDPAPAAAASPERSVSEPEAGPEAAASPPVSRRYVLERIRIDGLTRTRESEVRGRLDMVEGEVLDERAVLLARLRLLQLGWFSRVETRVERGSERGLVVLVVEVTERNTLVVSDLWLGSTPPQPLYGGLGLSEGNFLGRGLVVAGAFVYGGTGTGRPLTPARFALRGTVADPELSLGGVRLVAGLTGLFLRGEELLCEDPECDGWRNRWEDAPRLRYERLGGEATFGFRPGTFERLQAGLRVERVDATALDGSFTLGDGDAPFVRPGRSYLTAFTASYDRDTRNDLFLATAGTRLNLGLVLGTEALGGDYEYSRYLLQAETNHLLPSGHALKLLGAAGAVQGDAPFFERFYPADWSYFTVGPALGRALELNFSTDHRYDAYLAMLGAEYAVPLWGEGAFFHRGYLALGARWLTTMARAKAGRTPASSSPFSAEVALRLDTPIGSFNVSLGYALDNFL